MGTLVGRLRLWSVFRPPWQAAMSAAAPERLEKVPVLEERPAATRTCKARHSASSPGNRGHPGKRNNEKRRVLEEEVVQQISKQKHSGDVAKEQKPQNRGPALQITPCRLERKTGGHIIFLLTKKPNTQSGVGDRQKTTKLPYAKKTGCLAQPSLFSRPVVIDALLKLA
jgi:hypothetical protein